MLYLETPDPESAREILNREFSTLKIDSVALAPQGMDNFTFVINGELIFRFPKPSDLRQEKELWVLEQLRGKTTLPVPNPEWVSTSYFCSGYRMLPGEQLEPHLEDASEEEKALWIEQLVDLMAEIHSQVSIEEAEKHCVENEEPTFPSIQDGFPIPAEYLAIAEPMIERYLASKTPKRVIHFDLHSQNVLFDPLKRRVCGAIDFGDVCIANPAFDLGYLLEIDIAASPTISKRYELKTGVLIDPQEIFELYFLHNLNGMAEDEIPEPWFVSDVKRCYDFLGSRDDNRLYISQNQLNKGDGNASPCQ